MIEKLTAVMTSIIISVGGFFGLVPEDTIIDNTYTQQIQQLQEVVRALEAQVGEQEETIGSFAPAAGGTYRLKSSIGTTNTTITLSSFKEPVSDVPITMTSLDSDIGYATIDPQSSTRKEFISFTGITQNSDGSATLSGVTRGLAFTSPFTASTTLRKAHPGQSILILSDSPQLFLEYARRRSDETITGSWTIPTPTAAANPATKAYVDSVVNGGAVSLDSISMAAYAGESFSTGTVVYFDKRQKEWMKASAAVAASSTGVQLGIAQGAGINGETINGGVLTRGFDLTQEGVTAGNTIYLSDTAGATSTTAGTIPVVLGQGRYTGQFYFDPIYGNFAGLGYDNTFTGQNTFSATTTFSGDVRFASSTTYRVYTANDTWTKPANLSYIVIEVQGGGGGGAGADTDNNGTNGSAGAGGGYSKEILYAFELNSTETVTVGAAGSAGSSASSPTAGGAGGDSLFGSHATGSGGAGGAVTDAYSAGGSATGGDINIAGGPGTHGGLMTTYGHSIGGSSVLGHGGMFDNDSTFNGRDATGYGAGGPGGAATGSTDPNGRAGTAGVVIVTEYFN